ncbi:ImmA/IrrE family metallo-endopeptidase [Rosenbergiella australiborealis]|uniref:ImmA/IrrE family metallo-endopeptidase n=1 Tax=Rosenbergiella australiborealis TaxID=1544696 RepID=UPI001F4E51EB|nr:ImmA/IrrE family metallo-endopeptidase [Rosenbergiella australiborealis]
MPSIAAKHLLGKYLQGDSKITLPINPKDIAEKIYKISVIPVGDLDSNNISGELDYSNGKPIIKYNPWDSLKRQRFTIAHELGHYVLNHGHSFRDNNQNFTLNNFDIREVEANKFAAELLMPESAVSVLLNQRKINNLSELARLFDVSIPAMKYRLENLGYL